MKAIIQKLRNRENLQRIVTNGAGQRVRQHFQLNKKENRICWQMFHLPSNGDKSLAVEQNRYLSLKDVIQIIKTTK